MSPSSETKDRSKDFSEDGWPEWSRHVLMELERLNVKIETLSEEITNLKVRVGEIACIRCQFNPQDLVNLKIVQAEQKIRMGLLSVFFGILGGAIAFFISYFVKK